MKNSQLIQALLVATTATASNSRLSNAPMVLVAMYEGLIRPLTTIGASSPELTLWAPGMPEPPSFQWDKRLTTRKDGTTRTFGIWNDSFSIRDELKPLDILLDENRILTSLDAHVCERIDERDDREEPLDRDDREEHDERDDRKDRDDRDERLDRGEPPDRDERDERLDRDARKDLEDSEDREDRDDRDDHDQRLDRRVRRVRPDRPGRPEHRVRHGRRHRLDRAVRPDRADRARFTIRTKDLSSEALKCTKINIHMLPKGQSKPGSARPKREAASGLDSTPSSSPTYVLYSLSPDFPGPVDHGEGSVVNDRGSINDV